MSFPFPSRLFTANLNRKISIVSFLLCLFSSLTLPAQHSKVLDFNGTNGSEPWGSLISDGTFLYGMTGEGGTNDDGVIFKIMPDGSGYVKLFDFNSSVSGSFPPASLTYDGTFLYGMTTGGGANDLGTIFKIRTDGTGFQKLLDFNGPNGSRPYGTLYYDGTFLYGMTSVGGTNNLGTIFKILPDGTGYVKLLDFSGTGNGSYPQAALISDGTFLYGTTSLGGSGNGTVFKILKDGTGYVRLINFAGASNGREPFGSLLYDGTFLYGMTTEGGAVNDGVIFKIRTDGTGYAKLFDFDINNQHASTPFGDLVTDGVFLYGMSYVGGVGGTHDYGRLFKIRPDGTDFTPLHDFTTTANGWLPYGSPLLIGSALYGMTQQGGTSGVGTIFKYQLPMTPFITQWNLATAGSGATQLSFGTATSGTATYTWQQVPSGATGSGAWSGGTLTLTGLPAGATIRLEIAPTNFQRIIMNSGADANRLTLVEQWGSTVWTSMQRAFYDCQNLQITATDVPDLSGVTDMSEMFSGCLALNSPGNIGSWNTATITDMEFMFYGASAFNQNIGGWNTGAVTNMSTMFSEAAAFNQDIGSWNTGSVTDMSGMFQYATAFNQNIGTWNTSVVTDMSSMFSQAPSFNQNIGAWNTGAVNDMRNMFRLATSFNQNIGAWTLQPTVDVRNLFDDSGMDCGNYSATLLGWSANPATPSGRTLGATGRQYGTNAAAARINLTTTKGWTITGDTPSGAVCSVSGPTITSFTPASGPVGTTVIITGTNFDPTSANNTVLFNGMAAVVTASTTTSITVTVPAGATTGKISVTVAGNTATSTNDFTVSTGANHPPVIDETTTGVPIEGIVTIDLESLISDPDDNLDPASLYLVNSISEQGASATLTNGTFIVTLDYGNVPFYGIDRISIGICDLLSECVEQELTVEVSGEIIVYNALSPNQDNKNDKFMLEYIDIVPDALKNKVTIFNRWGDVVFEIKDYNNDDRVFTGLNKNGKELPSGTYFYKIEFSGGRKTQTGYLSLKR